METVSLTLGNSCITGSALTACTCGRIAGSRRAVCVCQSIVKPKNRHGMENLVSKGILMCRQRFISALYVATSFIRGFLMTCYSRRPCNYYPVLVLSATVVPSTYYSVVCSSVYYHVFTKHCSFVPGTTMILGSTPSELRSRIEPHWNEILQRLHVPPSNKEATLAEKILYALCRLKEE